MTEAEYRELLAKATPGIWETGDFHERNYIYAGRHHLACIGSSQPGYHLNADDSPNESDCNAALIVAAVTALPDHLDEIARLRARVEKLESATMWRDSDEPEHQLHDPFGYLDGWDDDFGHVHEIWQARQLPSIYVAALPPAADADSDDNWKCEAADKETCQALLDAEKARRAALEGQPHD